MTGLLSSVTILSYFTGLAGFKIDFRGFGGVGGGGSFLDFLEKKERKPPPRDLR